MTKQTAQEWLKQEVERLGYTVVEPIFTDMGFDLYTSFNEKIQVDVYDEEILFYKGDDGKFYGLDFSDLKLVLKLAEEYKRKLEEDE